MHHGIQTGLDPQFNAKVNRHDDDLVTLTISERGRFGGTTITMGRAEWAAALTALAGVDVTSPTLAGDERHLELIEGEVR